jgi:hypothetical protein
VQAASAFRSLYPFLWGIQLLIIYASLADSK